MDEPTVVVSRRAAQRARSGNPWIYRGELEKAEGLAGGEVVRVLDPRGGFVGKAFYSSKSLIALRLLAREEVKIDRDFWRQRLRAAAAYRQQIVTGSNAYRLVYGESDLLPSIIIDRYADCLVLQTLSQGAEKIKPLLVDLLIELFKPRAIVERNDVKTRELEGLALLSGVLYGSLPAEVLVEEHGLSFAADLIGGQKTGLFLDQRENRLAAAGYASGQALDCFCYVGAFALHLARRCARTIAVDISKEALARGAHNAGLNGIRNVDFLEANVFDLLHDFDRQGMKFDIVVLDPPAFAKSRDAVPTAVRGYKEINLRAMKLLRPAGVLVSCSCSYHISEEQLWEILISAAADARRSFQILEKRTQGRDHPILLALPETYYLKCFVLKAL